MNQPTCAPQEAQHRNFVLGFCVTILLGVVSIASLNLAIDPYGQYATRWIRPLVQDSRTEKTQLFDSFTEPPSGLILGSSRSMKLEPKYLQQKTGYRFFNFAVNHGRPEDFLAILRYYQHQHHCFPKVVVLGIDTASLNDKVPADARLSSEPRLFACIQGDLKWTEEFDRYTQLLSLHQSKSSFRSLVELSNPSSSTVASVDKMVFDENGVIHYEQRERDIATGTFELTKAMAYNKREFETIYADFPSLSKTRLYYLEQLFQLCSDNGCNLYVFRTVHHPELYAALKSSSTFVKRQREANDWLEHQSATRNFRYCDFDQISSFEGDEKQFVDGIHPLEENTRKMVDKLIRSVEGVAYAIQ